MRRGHLDGHIDGLAVDHSADCKAIGLAFDVLDVGIRLSRVAASDDPGRAMIAGRLRKHGAIGIIGVQHRNPAGLKTKENFSLGGGDIIKAIEKPAMAVADAGDHRDIGGNHGAQRGDLTAVIHAQFKNAIGAVLRHQSKAERRADVIVEIARRSMGFAQGLQTCADDLLSAGLAHGAGDGHHGGRTALTRRLCQITQSHKAITRDQLRDRGIDLAADQSGNRASISGGGNIIMAIVILTLQGDEQIPGVGFAIIERHARDAPIGIPMQSGMGCGDHVLGVPDHAAPPCSTSAAISLMMALTTASSLKGRVSDPIN